MSDEDAIGVTCAHRWATLERQRIMLKEDGCRVIFNLGEHSRAQLVPMIRQGTVLKLAYAFLLSEFDRGAFRALIDYRTFAARIAKLPRQCSGYVKDLETGLVGNTQGTRKAMLAVVKDQLARHGKGLRSAENGKQGGQPKEFTETEWAKAEAIWFNTKRYPNWEDAELALANLNKDFTVWRAHAKWGPRKFGMNRPRR